MARLSSLILFAIAIISCSSCSGLPISSQPENQNPGISRRPASNLCEDVFTDFTAEPFTQDNSASYGAQSVIARSGRRLKLFSNPKRISVTDLKSIEGLGVGDEITMPSGRSYLVHAVLDGNRGSFSRVIDIGDGWVLRLPLSPDKSGATDGVAEAMASFIEVQQDLKNHQVEVVEVDETRSELPFGIVAKKHSFVFEGDQFCRYFNDPKLYTGDPEILKLATRRLLEFFDTTCGYERIGDFRAAQTGFDGEKWIIFDVGNNYNPTHRPLTNFTVHETTASATGIDNGDGGVLYVNLFPPQIAKEVEKRIGKIRQKIAKSGRWFERKSSSHSGFQLINSVTIAPLPRGWTRTFKFREDWDRRYISGNLLPGDKLEIQVVDQLPKAKRKDLKSNFDAYQIILNQNKSGTLLTFFSDVDEKPKLQKTIEKLKKRGIPYFAGFDFVVTYE